MECNGAQLINKICGKSISNHNICWFYSRINWPISQTKLGQCKINKLLSYIKGNENKGLKAIDDITAIVIEYF